MLKVTILATFTPDPIRKSMRFWGNTFGLDLQLEFASYNQVFQQLLNPNKCIVQNGQEVYLLLICLEDWVYIPHGPAGQAGRPSLRQLDARAPEVSCSLRKVVHEFIAVLKTTISPLSAPHLVMFCPPAYGEMEETTEESSLTHMFREIEQEIVEETHGTENLYFVTTEELQRIYPVQEYYDPYADRIAHIPFTDECFTAFGTMAMRKIVALQRPPYKVIVLDCDHTLWQGVCAEDGHENISIEEPYLTVQMFMRAQYEAGMLLCLCSKNREKDVFDVFVNRSEMLLTLDHVVGWRINWQPKSENIKSLAKELNLGLDSFIFVDDNPIECAEVQANCPEVFTIQLPTEVSNIPHVLEHVWAFDHMKITQEDRGRTLQYQQNIEREQACKNALSLEDFIATLQLSVHISAMRKSQLLRVSQLTQRTNQFNLTTRRCTEGDIQHWIQQPDRHVLVVEVSDRFGDYGLVGVILYRIEALHLDVDSFLLSCRVLGRGVEHRMLEEIGRIAGKHGLNTAQVVYRPTRKSKPAFDFIRSIAASVDQCLPTHSEILNNEEEVRVTFPTQTLQTLSCLTMTSATQSDQLNDGVASSDQEKKSNNDALNPIRSISDLSRVFIWISEEMANAKKILQHVLAEKRPRPVSQQTYVGARTETERLLRAIWMDVLALEDIGLNDSLEELGCSSLHVVQIHSKLAKLFSSTNTSASIPVTTIFQYPTIRKLASFIDRGNNDPQALAYIVKSRAALQQSAFLRFREGRKNLPAKGAHL
ncbi:MAG: hypothetical protein NPIRA02_05210 [Nitrospirales bacterium]|nr:MAG: hypothetical protein NPIRA02_05210 [Nitrospirales bacterium]